MSVDKQDFCSRLDVEFTGITDSASSLSGQTKLVCRRHPSLQWNFRKTASLSHTHSQEQPVWILPSLHPSHILGNNTDSLSAPLRINIFVFITIALDIKHDFSPECRGCGINAGSVSTLLSLLCYQLHRDMEFHSISGMQLQLLKAAMRCSSLLNSIQQCVHCFEQFDTQRCFLQVDFCCFLFVDMIHLSGYVLGLSAPLPKWRLHIFILAVSGFHLKM